MWVTDLQWDYKRPETVVTGLDPTMPVVDRMREVFHHIIEMLDCDPLHVEAALWIIVAVGSVKQTVLNTHVLRMLYSTLRGMATLRGIRFPSMCWYELDKLKLAAADLKPKLANARAKHGPAVLQLVDARPQTICHLVAKVLYYMTINKVFKLEVHPTQCTCATVPIPSELCDQTFVVFRLSGPNVSQLHCNSNSWAFEQSFPQTHLYHTALRIHGVFSSHYLVPPSSRPGLTPDSILQPLAWQAWQSRGSLLLDDSQYELLSQCCRALVEWHTNYSQAYWSGLWERTLICLDEDINGLFLKALHELYERLTLLDADMQALAPGTHRLVLPMLHYSTLWGYTHTQVSSDVEHQFEEQSKQYMVDCMKAARVWYPVSHIHCVSTALWPQQMEGWLTQIMAFPKLACACPAVLAVVRDNNPRVGQVWVVTLVMYHMREHRAALINLPLKLAMRIAPKQVRHHFVDVRGFASVPHSEIMEDTESTLF